MEVINAQMHALYLESMIAQPNEHYVFFDQPASFPRTAAQQNIIGAARELADLVRVTGECIPELEDIEATAYEQYGSHFVAVGEFVHRLPEFAKHHISGVPLLPRIAFPHDRTVWKMAYHVNQQVNHQVPEWLTINLSKRSNTGSFSYSFQGALTDAKITLQDRQVFFRAADRRMAVTGSKELNHCLTKIAFTDELAYYMGLFL